LQESDDSDAHGMASVSTESTSSHNTGWAFRFQPPF
jgi:hypothetical protein